MTIGGNLAFQSGALYLVQLDPRAASSANVIAGSATLAGATVQAIFAPGSLYRKELRPSCTAAGEASAAPRSLA